MGYDTIVATVQACPKQMPIEDIATLFARQGWTMTVQSSHYKFKKQGHTTFHIAARKGQYVIQGYIRDIGKRMNTQGEIQ